MENGRRWLSLSDNSRTLSLVEEDREREEERRPWKVVEACYREPSRVTSPLLYIHYPIAHTGLRN